MGRRLLVCAPLASAALLVGCLLRPSNSGKKGDAGTSPTDGAHGGPDAARSDGAVPDGTPPMDASVQGDGPSTGGACPAAIDTFMGGKCGIGMYSGSGTAMATGGVLTIGPGAVCQWSTSMVGGGVRVHISMAPLPQGNSVDIHIGAATITAMTFGTMARAGNPPATFGTDVSLLGGTGTTITSYAFYVAVVPGGTGSGATAKVYAGTNADPSLMSQIGTTSASGLGAITFDMSTSSTSFDELSCL